MSVINEALKKAQKEKEYRELEFAGALASGARKRIFPPGSFLFYSLAFIAVILLAFISYSWLKSKSDKTEALSEFHAPNPIKDITEMLLALRDARW